jgi:methylglyoxal synthase
MKLVSRVVDSDPAKAVDAVIYLIDPVDPSSVFPEAVALKRQCVIHRKPFLATLAGAREWLELEATVNGAPTDPALNASFVLNNEGIALIAHDAMKEKCWRWQKSISMCWISLRIGMRLAPLVVC